MTIECCSTARIEPGVAETVARCQCPLRVVRLLDHDTSGALGAVVTEDPDPAPGGLSQFASVHAVN
jgi:hypothetical protein